MIGRTWQLQDAKNKFSDVVSAALRQGPQIITRRGIQTAVVISYEEYTRLQKPDTDIVTFFANSPLAGVDLDLERERNLPRDAAL
jgi:prevent-host-death family protein